MPAKATNRIKQLAIAEPSSRLLTVIFRSAGDMISLDSLVRAAGTARQDPPWLGLLRQYREHEAQFMVLRVGRGLAYCEDSGVPVCTTRRARSVDRATLSVILTPTSGSLLAARSVTRRGLDREGKPKHR